MVIVINFLMGGIGWLDLIWLVASTVRSQLSHYSQLSSYSCTEWLLKNKAANASITFQEILMVIIIAYIACSRHSVGKQSVIVNNAIVAEMRKSERGLGWVTQWTPPNPSLSHCFTFLLQSSLHFTNWTPGMSQCLKRPYIILKIVFVLSVSN